MQQVDTFARRPARAAIEGILAGTAYTELGWESAAPAPDGR
ncbi:hypothetical protein ACFRCI_42375 [Streptomyces sp. NPDC056638]